VNAAVVGLLLDGSLSAGLDQRDSQRGRFCLGLVAFGLLMFWKLPPWLVVLISAVGGALLAALRGVS
jgi:chromate transporter